VSSGGIVRDAKVHRRVIDDVTAGIVAAGFEAHGWMESPLKGAVGGNSEFLAHFTRLQYADALDMG
jgi:23S rRNA (cytidine1920-2'-O)/16S rRNA (cytidine1409-2'-O)-methyltransferase